MYFNRRIEVVPLQKQLNREIMQETNEQYLERMWVKSQQENANLKRELQAYKNLVAQMEANLKAALEMNGLTNKLQEK